MNWQPVTKPSFGQLVLLSTLLQLSWDLTLSARIERKLTRALSPVVLNIKNDLIDFEQITML
jgi:hypothetical protein